MQESGEYVYWGGQRDPFFTVNQFSTISIIGFNPLSPNIHIQILQTDLYTFPLRIS